MNITSSYRHIITSSHHREKEAKEKELKKERRKEKAKERKKEKEEEERRRREERKKMRDGSEDEDEDGNFDDVHNDGDDNEGVVSGAMDTFAVKSPTSKKDKRILRDGRRRVIKKRTVEKMTTDEKGFMHCEQYEEEYSTEEEYDPNVEDTSPSPGKKTP